MKRLLTVLLICSSGLVKAQNTASPIKEIAVSPNFVGIPSLSVYVQLKLDASTQAIDHDYYINKDSIPKFKLTYSGKSYDTGCVKVEFYSDSAGIGFQIKGLNNEFVQRFQAKDNQISLQVNSDIVVALLNKKDNTTSRIVIRKDSVNNVIKNQLSIADSTRNLYLSALNNFYYYENIFDFGVQPATGKDTSTSYAITFQMKNRYSINNLLKCDTSKKNAPHLYWSLSGRLSTNFADTLNYINYYPVNLQFGDFTSNSPYELNFKLGNESNQTFSNKRVVVDGSYTFILPNLVNLADPASNRLRLKPIVSAGIKGYYDYSNDTTHFSSGQAYLNLHYYIPIFNHYALIIDEAPFYDFSTEKNPSHKVQNNYSITLGAEIPKTGFKAMFKYTNGASNINFKKGEIISIGLLMDFFQEKSNTK